MKKFYKAATAIETGDGWQVQLDGRPVRTPARTLVEVPTEALAREMAAEWDAQGEKIVPDSMPITSLASTALDRVAPRRGEVLDELVGYAEADLVCYRADTPAELADRQEKVWQPLADWFGATVGGSLVVTSGVMPATQTPETLSAVRATLAAHDSFSLTGIHGLIGNCGSVVIGLAIALGRVSPEEGFAASILDETYQIESWGEDEEAAARRARIRTDVLTAAKFLTLTRT